jgi:hypothetical protein
MKSQRGKLSFSSTPSLTSELGGLGGEHHTPAALHPRKARYPLYRSLGGPQGRSGYVQEISPSSGFDPRTFQPVASRYTDWAIPAHEKKGCLLGMYSDNKFLMILYAHISFSIVTIRLDAVYAGTEPKVPLTCSPPLKFILLSQIELHTMKFNTHSAASLLDLNLKVQCTSQMAL